MRLVCVHPSPRASRWLAALVLFACAANSYAQAYKIKPPVDTDYYYNGAPSTDQVNLGRFLFYDKILSGNKNIACSTCHGPMGHTGDNLSLPVGEGGTGFGTSRQLNSVVARVPRNASPLYNVGAKWFFELFDDGRVEVDASAPSGFNTPAGNDLPLGLDNVLAAQALFPVQSPVEMAGQPGSNPIADAAAIGDLAGPTGVWEQLAERLRAIPEYVDLFKTAFPSEISTAQDITMVYAANAIAAFETVAYRSSNSPFDLYWQGQFTVMNYNQRNGMQLFYTTAKCATCHAGALQTDMQFHAICMPQIGPGKGDGPDGLDDYGRARVTNNALDRFKFKTPSLRNVALTAPYGHDGAYATLEAVVQHHLNPITGINSYDTSQAVLPQRADLSATDFIIQNNPQRRAAIVNGQKFKVPKLTKTQVANIIEFLKALTDPASVDLTGEIPDHIPSGLPLGD